MFNSFRNNNRPEASTRSFQTAASQQTSHSSTFHRGLRHLVDEINGAILPEQTRISSISRAHQEFDHNTRELHDSELNNGAAEALYNKLAFAVATKASEKEVLLICSGLEMVHRASQEAVESCFTDIGFDCLPLLVKVLRLPYYESLPRDFFDTHDGSVAGHNPYMSSGKSIATTEHAIQQSGNRASQDMKAAVQKACRILATYSLVHSAKLAMAKSPNLLASLVRVTDRSSGMTEAARYSALATLANLAHADENHIVMAKEPNLINALAKMARPDESDMARQCSALALMHLSYGNRDHVPLAENELILDTFIVLLRDDNPETRRNAAVGLYNFASADENAVRLVNHRRGVILEVLVLILSNHNHPDEARVLAAQTLQNMSASDIREITERVTHHPGLLMALGSVLKFRGAPYRVQEVSAETLHRLSQVTFSSMSSHEVLLTSLVQACEWTHTPKVAESLEVQASTPDHRTIMVNHVGLLDGLATQALARGEGTEPVREAAVSTIQKLTIEEINRRPMAAHEGIMTALTSATFDDGDYDLEEEEEEEDLLHNPRKPGQAAPEPRTPRGHVRVALKRLNNVED